MSTASHTIPSSRDIANARHFLARVLPSTFRGAASQTEIINPPNIPAWMGEAPWIVDSRGSVFVRLA